MKAEFRKISMSPSVNKSVGEDCFCVPCPFTTRAPRELLDPLM